MVDTCVTLAIGVSFFTINIVDFNYPVSYFECLLDRLRNTTQLCRAHGNAVDDDLNVVFIFFIERREFVESIHDTVYPCTGKSKSGVLLWNMGEFSFFILHYRRQNHHFRAFGKLHDFVNDSLWGAT